MYSEDNALAKILRQVCSSNPSSPPRIIIASTVQANIYNKKIQSAFILAF